jgi:hypothetical protein
MNPKMALRRYQFTDLQADLDQLVAPDTSVADTPVVETEPTTAAATPLTPEEIAQLPAKWHAYMFVEGLQTTDGRAAELNAGSTRPLPLPLMWQRETDYGHTDAVTVGAIETSERIDQDGGTWALIYQTGSFDLGGEHGQECARQVALQGGTRFVSADIEVLASNYCSGDTGEPISGDDFWDALFYGSVYEVMTSYRMMGGTIVSKPAFPQCVIAPIDVTLEIVPPMGTGVEPPPVTVPMLVASGANFRDGAAPSAWFAQPALSGPTPLTVTEEGRVYGHLADWRTPHTGYGNTKKYAPHSSESYPFFLTGDYPCSDDVNVRVGQLSMNCGHADLGVDVWAAKAHYSPNKANYDGGPGAIMAADVTVGEDEWGIWCAGAMRPDLTAAQIREFMALSPSGDWRWINGHYEMCACCQVPVPGFPIPRGLAAAGGPAFEADGRAWEHYERVGDEMVCTAMVAAGRVVHDPARDMFLALSARLHVLEETIKAAGLTAAAVDRLAASINV